MMGKVRFVHSAADILSRAVRESAMPGPPPSSMVLRLWNLRPTASAERAAELEGQQPFNRVKGRDEGATVA